MSVNPNCRYHQDAPLERIATGNKTPHWALLTCDQRRVFELDLYVCPRCGYAELFDPQSPDLTQD